MKTNLRPTKLTLLLGLLVLSGLTAYAYRTSALWRDQSVTPTKQPTAILSHPRGRNAARPVVTLTSAAVLTRSEVSLTTEAAVEPAQSGGSYNITQSVISGGGGTSANGTTNITGTVGQSAAAASSGGQYAVSGGFWIATSGSNCPTITLPPIAASGEIGALYNQSTNASPPGSYTYAMTSGAPPPGVIFYAQAALLYGFLTTAGTYNFTIMATNATGCTASRSYTVYINNTPPAITPACVTRTVGAPVSNSTIATVSDAEQTAGTLTVAVDSANPSNGVTLSNIVNTGGTVTADIVAASGATTTSFTLKVTDGANAAATTTLTVTVSATPADLVSNNNDSGAGSLRAAITNVCAGGTITFAANVTGAINLTSGELLLNKPLTINGPGAHLLAVQRSAAPGTPAFRVFNIALGRFGYTTLSGLTIANGNVPGGGGGIFNAGALTITNSAISGNTTSASYGGGIFNTGTLTIINSTLSGNLTTGGFGGGISNSGMVNLTNSTLSGNTASDPGLGLSSGGGIHNNGTVNLTNSTIVGNTAQFRGGGIINNSTVTARNTVIALNTAGAGGGPDTFGVLTSQGFNLIGDSSGATISPAQSSDQIGRTPAQLNLGPLQNNGGPTETHALLPGSTAIDKGHGSGSATDQRGFTRPVDLPNIPNVSGGDGSDIGAFEVQTITISPAILPIGMAGTSYSQLLSQSGGVGPITWSISVGALPTGITLNPASGLLSGAPTVFGPFNFTVRATDVNLSIGERAYLLTINPPCGTITVNPASLPNGSVGTAYNQTATATGGTGSYTFTVSVGGLPGGLNLASGGALTGTPNTSGTFNFTIKATDANGCMDTRAYTVTISGGVANNGLQFYPLPAPVRLLDTRGNLVSPNACTVNDSQPITGGTSLLQIARGICTIPATAQAITGNVTTVTSGGGYLTIYPSGAVRPTVASINYNPNEIVNNVFTSGLGADGNFNIYALNTTDTIIDVTGYYAPPIAGGLYFHPLPAPVRLLETRAGQPVGCVKPGAPLAGGADSLQTATTACTGIPAAARAIVGNATTVSPQGGGYLTLFPADAARPLIASSNYDTNQIVNGPFTTGLSASGQFKVFTYATTDLVIDVLGYYSTEANDANGAGLLFTPLAHPVRLLETRNVPTFPGCFKPNAPLGGNQVYTQPARGLCDGLTIPASALGVVGNATTVSPQGGGYLTLWPSAAAQPTVATLNYNTGQIVNRHFIVGLGNADGAFKMFSYATTDLVIDLTGYFAP